MITDYSIFVDICPVLFDGSINFDKRSIFFINGYNKNGRFARSVCQKSEIFATFPRGEGFGCTAKLFSRILTVGDFFDTLKRAIPRWESPVKVSNRWKDYLM